MDSEQTAQDAVDQVMAEDATALADSAQDTPAEPDAAAASPVEGAPAADEAPAAWAFPGGREHYEALVRDAQLGREFAPFADTIRAQFRRGIEGGFEKDAPATRQADEDAEVQRYFGSHAAWARFCEDMKGDHNVFVKGVEALISRARNRDVTAISDLKKQNEALQNELTELRGFARLASHRFEESKRWKEHGKAVTELFERGLVNVAGDPEAAIAFAFDVAEKAARAQGATRAQAAQAGAAAARAQATSQGASPSQARAAAVKAAAQSEPRREPSLESGQRTSRSGDSGGDEQKLKAALAGKHYATRVAEWAVAKAARQK